MPETTNREALYATCVNFLASAVERRDADKVKFWIGQCHKMYKSLDKAPNDAYLDDRLRKKALEIIVKDSRNK